MTGSTLIYPHGRSDKPDRHKAELYDLKTDPDERVNLISDQKFERKGGVIKKLSWGV